MLSDSDGRNEPPLLEETIGRNLWRTVERFAGREALVVAHQRYRATYRELWDEADIAARALLANRVHKGDRIGVWAPERYEWVVMQFATARAGAIMVDLNSAETPTELEYAVRDARVSLFMTLESVRAGGCPELPNPIVLERDWDTFLAQGACIDERALTEREATLGPLDPIYIRYTSTASGLPDKATLSHRDVLDTGRRFAHTLRCTALAAERCPALYGLPSPPRTVSRSRP